MQNDNSNAGDRKTRFAQARAALVEVFPHESLTTARLEVYYKALEDVPIETIERNAWHHVKTALFFPKPVQLRHEGGNTMRPIYHDEPELYHGKKKHFFPPKARALVTNVIKGDLDGILNSSKKGPDETGE